MKCALVGNQNSGKTTFFNLLTGMNQTVGNWPGVTIERKEGKIRGTDITVVDLPGIYSLSPYTAEEEVSRRYVMEEKPDLIINIIDATSLERSLYLTSQLLELDSKVIIALNMADLMAKRGVSIDVDGLSRALGTTVVSVSALKKTGIGELIGKITGNQVLPNPHKNIYSPEVRETLDFISAHAARPLTIFDQVKIFERDPAYAKYAGGPIEDRIKACEKELSMDSEEIIASQRYDFIGRIKKKTVAVIGRNRSVTDKIDAVVMNKYFALPIFFVIMGLVYFLSVGVVGQLTSDLVSGFFNGMTEISIFGNAIPLTYIGLGPWLGSLIGQAGGSPWAVSLVSDGIVAGVGAVLTFLPQLMALFFFLSILETSGYMSRISFMFDKIFKHFGLSGKSLIPFIVGSGCSVPGIMNARTVENDSERKLTILLTPFIPCSAKLTIISVFAGAFFGSNAWLVTFSIYLFAVFTILFWAYILKKLLARPAQTSYISELPEYHVPSPRYVARDVYDRSFAFIKKASTVILLCSVIVWFLASFTWNLSYVDDQTVFIGSSMLASIGNALAWIFYPMLGGHLSWAAAVSALQGLIAKEQVVSSMRIIAGISGTDAGFSFLLSPTYSFFNGWSAYAFMIFNLFSAPCVAAMSAMKTEFGSFKMMLAAVLFQTGTALVISSLIGLIGWAVTSL